MKPRITKKLIELGHVNEVLFNYKSVIKPRYTCIYYDLTNQAISIKFYNIGYTHSKIPIESVYTQHRSTKAGTGLNYNL